MPIASIIVPAFNVSATLRQTLDALLQQTHSDFEIVIVDDGSTDDTVDVANSVIGDPRVRLIQQRNRGLAGARNSGIAAARGKYIGFCDADDLWMPEKLARHVAHLDSDPSVGISFSGSALIDDNGKSLGQSQSPRLRNIDAAHIFKRNPIGNGSAPVMRRELFDNIAFRPHFEKERDWYFDETFRQSEDIECWLRIALTTDWKLEGIPGLLTQYRINSSGLSSATDLQLAAWEQMVTKLRAYSPEFFKKHTATARAYQLRYLARRAVSDLDEGRAMHLALQSIKQSLTPMWEEPSKSLTTLLAAFFLRFGGKSTLQTLMIIKAARA